VEKATKHNTYKSFEI